MKKNQLFDNILFNKTHYINKSQQKMFDNRQIYSFDYSLSYCDMRKESGSTNDLKIFYPQGKRKEV